MFGPRLWTAALVGAALVSMSSSAWAQPRASGGLGITVWSNANFLGESATFRNPVPDLRSFRFDAKISSFRIGPNEFWEVCEQPNFSGRCKVFSGEERNLRGTSWNDRINSLRRVNYSGGDFVPAPGGAPRVILYSQPNFQGQRMAVTRSTADLKRHGFSDRARSARVVGSWQFCQEAQFATCTEVTGDQPNLANVGLSANVTSIRPTPTGGVAPRLVLFGGLNMTGLSRDYNAAIGNTNVPRARSASVQGKWFVCAGTNFRPPCRTLTRDMPDLLASGLTTILSARPE